MHQSKKVCQLSSITPICSVGKLLANPGFESDKLQFVEMIKGCKILILCTVELQREVEGIKSLQPLFCLMKRSTLEVYLRT